ncbi:MAG TPA: LuxR C-terminal-related transcriptional regulator [Synergistaceae bacterium]|nr:LuxR C-terminal-related transcriptional regulator [Synergistaceae bacterium]HQH78709.1 LuxR C-terminal-related transcriptional regulator [Synergistaceae bacterium]
MGHERWLYELREKGLRDIATLQKHARQEGHEEGIDKGIDKGRGEALCASASARFFVPPEAKEKRWDHIATPKYHPKVHYCSERLRSKLLQVPRSRTTFVEAPSGAGKTTTFRDHFSSSEEKGVAVRWFVASEEPLTSGWLRLSREIEAIDPQGGERLRRLGLPGEENQGEVAQALMELRCDRETYLVCDNFQHLQRSLPSAVWRALVDHGGRELRLIILTQQLPFRGLAILGNSDVLRIENDDLCLKAEEIGEYYRMAGVELTEAQMRQLHAYSEGWIAALYLQLESFVRTGSLEGKASIYEMMNDLFWRRISREEQEAIFRLSPFDSVTVRQACFLLGVESLPEPLAELLHQGMLIRYDIAERRYFPHAILWDFVRSALLEEPEALRREVWRRSGEWSAQQGEKTQAIIFFHRLGDFAAILALDLRCVDMSRAILDLGAKEMGSILRDIADRATPELRRDHAFTMISVAFEAFTLGDGPLYERLCREMKDLLEESDLDPARRRSLLGELALTESFGQYNDIEGMGRGHQRAHELLGTHSTLFNPDSPWTLGWPSVLGMYHRTCGGMDEEMAQMDYWIPRYNALTLGNGSGADFVFRAEVELHRGDDAGAERGALKALDVARHQGQDSLAICAAFLIQRVALLRGDREAWDAGKNLMEQISRSSTYTLSRRIADMAAGFMAVLLDDPEGVPPWIRNGHFMETLSPALPFACTIYGRLLLLTGQERELLLRSEEFLSAARRQRSLLAEVYGMIAVAAMQGRLGKEDEGEKTLGLALDLALPDGLILPFAENGDLLGGILGRTLSRSWKEKRPVILALKDRFTRGKEALLQRRRSEGIPGDLTFREHEVARRAAEGQSNREIAEALFLSENTVKHYLKAIFRKMEVDSRRALKEALRSFHP